MRPDAFMIFQRNAANIVTGESTDPQSQFVEGQPLGSEILSLRQSVTERPNHAPGSGGSNAIHAPFHIVKPVDNASPKLQDLVEKAYTDLKVLVVLMHREGTSTQASDQWKRDSVIEYELDQARVTRVQIVLDPRVHKIANTMWPSDVLDAGPLEEVTIEYKEYAMSYGTTSNKVKWTYQAGDE